MSEAAKVYGIPQSAISITIGKLEKELGVKLFDRVGRHILLNRAGKIFYDHARNSLAELQDAAQLLCHKEVAGGIRILVLEHRHRIANCVIAFCREYPEMELQILHSTPEGQQDFDLCIAAFPPTGEDYDSVLLAEEEIVLAVSCQNPLSQRETVSMHELQGQRFLFLPEHNSVTRIMLEQFRKRNLMPYAVITCDDPYCIRKYISADTGVAFVPRNSWQGLYAENVKLIPLEDVRATRTTYIYTRKNNYLTEAAKTFRTYLKQAFQ